MYANVLNYDENLQESTAKQLYSEVPESTFTRTVSNPEAVMKKRREQKLQKRGGIGTCCSGAFLFEPSRLTTNKRTVNQLTAIFRLVGGQFAVVS